MVLNEILEKRDISIYKLSKLSQIPYTTCRDIVSGRARLEKCSAETVYKLCRALDVSMDELLASCFDERSSFENFKSTICHRVKELGDIDFIIDTLEKQYIRKYYERKWYPESLYLLAMLDYISRENGVPICDEYDDIRKCRLEKPIYPSGILAMAAVSENNDGLENALRKAIPEFIRFNIVESEIRNVI